MKDNTAEVMKAIRGAPWNSDLFAAAIRKRYPGVRQASGADQVRDLKAKGYKLLAMTRNPIFPESFVPHFYMVPMTAEDRKQDAQAKAWAEITENW